jgi:hypothetical protein
MLTDRSNYEGKHCYTLDRTFKLIEAKHLPIMEVIDEF